MSIVRPTEIDPDRPMYCVMTILYVIFILERVRVLGIAVDCRGNSEGFIRSIMGVRQYEIHQ